MSTQVQFKRGSTSDNDSYTGPLGEITIDTDKKQVVVHDGVTVGGYRLDEYVVGTSSGANQSVSFAKNGVHRADCTGGLPTYTFTFNNPSNVSRVDLILELVEESFDISSATYDNVSFSVSSQDGQPLGIAFSSDGTKMFMLGFDNDRVYQYTLSTAWDISTASYDSVSLNVTSQEPQPSSIKFSSDGTKMFMIGTQNNSVHQYTLSTGWDLSTVSYDNISFNINAQDGAPFGIAFSADGTKMIMLGTDTDSVHQYSLSTAWDISSASYDNVSFSVSSQDSTPRDIAFSSDGTKMFMVGDQNNSVYQYTLSTWNISTASYDNVSFSVSSQDNAPRCIAFSSDGTKMFMSGNSSDSVHQYTTGTYPEIVMPESLEWNPPEITNNTLALTIITTDGGTTYKTISISNY